MKLRQHLEASSSRATLHSGSAAMETKSEDPEKPAPLPFTIDVWYVHRTPLGPVEEHADSRGTCGNDFAVKCTRSVIETDISSRKALEALRIFKRHSRFGGRNVSFALMIIFCRFVSHRERLVATTIWLRMAEGILGEEWTVVSLMVSHQLPTKGLRTLLLQRGSPIYIYQDP